MRFVGTVILLSVGGVGLLGAIAELVEPPEVAVSDLALHAGGLVQVSGTVVSVSPWRAGRGATMVVAEDGAEASVLVRGDVPAVGPGAVVRVVGRVDLSRGEVRVFAEPAGVSWG
ncbi:MAG: hypothetical protein ACT4PT_05670 [Methanobacteriota archaeon]